MGYLFLAFMGILGIFGFIFYLIHRSSKTRFYKVTFVYTKYGQMMHGRQIEIGKEYSKVVFGMNKKEAIESFLLNFYSDRCVEIVEITECL